MPSNNAYDLAGRKVLIAGAGSVKDTPEFGRLEGIGTAAARLLARSGADLLLTYHTSRAGAQALREEILRDVPGRRIACLPFDAEAYPESVPRLLASAEREGFFPDVLVHNLGTTQVQPSGIPHDEPAAAAERLMRVNFFAPYELSKRVLERWTAEGTKGRLVLVTSVSVRMPHARRPGYGATKRALRGMGVEFASHYGPRGILVFDLELGIFETPMVAPRLAEYREAALGPALPLRRLGRPEEAAHLIAFLLSGACDYLAGSPIRADGGLSIKSFDEVLEGK